MKKRIWIVALLALMMTLVSASALAACGYTWTEEGVQYTCTETSHEIKSAWFESAENGQCIHYVYHYDEAKEKATSVRVVYADHNMKFVGNDTEPTCQKTGTARHACTVCEYPVLSTAPKADHHYDPNGQVTLEAATCQQPALVRQSCIYGCGAYQDVYDGSALSYHKTATRVGEEATCAKDGYYVDYCQWCQRELGKGDTIPATGKHDYEVTEDVYLTCVSDGHKTWTCTVCGGTKTETYEANDVYGHSWTTQTKQPTCIEDGFTGDVCIHCGDWHNNVQVLLAPGHKYGKETEVQAPTCTINGLSTKTCSVCGDVEEIITEGGECQYETVTVPCTASARGYSVEKCVNCLTEKNKTEHTGTYEDAKTDAPGCVTEGQVHTLCSVCHVKLSSVTVSGPGHNWNQTGQTIGDCTKEGIRTSYICKVCGETLVKGEVFFQHDYVSQNEVPATCTAEGSVTEKCSVCGKVNTRTLRKLEHLNVVYEAVPATCTELGRTAGVKCSVCYQVQSGMEEIPALGHDAALSDEEIVAIQNRMDLCVEDGEYETKCFVCGETFTEVIPARGYHENRLSDEHIASLQYDNGLCYEDGEAEVKCYWCGEKYVITVPARGYHIIMEDGKLPYPRYYGAQKDEILVDWNIDPALCTLPVYNACFESSSETWNCGCGSSWYVNVPAAGKHIDVQGAERGFCPTCGECDHPLPDYFSDPIHEVVQEATCTEDGIQLHICNQKITINASGVPDGEKEYYCTYSFEEPLYSTGHTWGEWQDGIAVCSVCGITGESGQRPVCTDGHTPIDCLGYVMVCSVCGEKLTDIANECNHTADDTKEKKAVLIGKGLYSEYICTECGEAFLMPEDVWVLLDLDGGHNNPPVYGCEHDEMILVTDKQATCTEKGANHIECMICGSCFVSGVIPSGGHVTEADLTEERIAQLQEEMGLCHEDGEYSSTCTFCGETFTAVIPAAGQHIGFAKPQHYPIIYIAETDTLLADYSISIFSDLCTEPLYNLCNTSVSHTVTCVCGEQRTVNVPQAPYHIKSQPCCIDYCFTCGTCFHPDNCAGEAIHEIIQAPTCTEPGVRLHICNNKLYMGAVGAPGGLTGDFRCTYQVEEAAPATGHTWGEWQDNGNGLQVSYCTVCGEEGLGGQPVCTQHVPIEDEYGKMICFVCGQELPDAAVTACNHTAGNTKKREIALIDGNPYYIDTCTQCGQKFCVPMVFFVIVNFDTGYRSCGHDEGFVLIVDKAPTCLEEGSNYMVCLECNEKVATGIMPAADHTWSEWVRVDAETEKQTCSVCTLSRVRMNYHNDMDVPADPLVDDMVSADGQAD